MMGRRLPANTGDERDAITEWRHVCKHLSRPGARASLKRAMRRRERQAAQEDIADHVGFWDPNEFGGDE
jgi:hypothetical protein